MMFRGRGINTSSFFITVIEIEKIFGRGKCENKPFVKNLTKYSRNTTPYYIYYIIYIPIVAHKKAVKKFLKKLKKVLTSGFTCGNILTEPNKRRTK